VELMSTPINGGVRVEKKSNFKLKFPFDIDLDCQYYLQSFTNPSNKVKTSKGNFILIQCL